LTTLQIQTPRIFKPLLARSRYKGIYGGRASGKSHFFAELAIERCIESKTLIVCIREIQKSLEQSVKRLLENKIQALGVGHLFEIQHDRIIAPHGGLIIFQGMQNHTADSIKSLEGFDVAWIEEGQTFSQYSLDILRPTILRKQGAEIWCGWNPRYKTDPVDTFFRQNTPIDSIVVEANYHDNPFLAEAIVEEAEYDRLRDVDKYNWVWLGKYNDKSDARVFKNWRIKEFELPESTIFRLGADWGYAQDPSVLIRCAIDGKLLYLDYEAYMIGCETDQLPDLFDRVPDARKWFITADSARPETISYMQNHGYPRITPAYKGAGSVEDGLEFLKSYDIVVHPRCIHAIDELNNYSFKVDPLTDKVLPILEDKNNHVIDAIRYACEGARKALENEIVWQPLKITRKYK
jgi:phage terminase large subunit